MVYAVSQIPRPGIIDVDLMEVVWIYPTFWSVSILEQEMTVQSTLRDTGRPQSDQVMLKYQLYSVVSSTFSKPDCLKYRIHE